MVPISFGILCIEYQAIDVTGPMDILFNASKQMLSAYNYLGVVPEGAIEKASPIIFHHIGETLDPVPLTGSMKIVPSTTCDDCPELDYLLVGGPRPPSQISPTFIKFVQKHVAAGKGVFTTCTGAMAIAPAGVLDGKNATVNRSLLDIAKNLYPSVKWTKEKQWIMDGNIWTSGGACAGMDMIAYWIEQTFGKDVASVSYELLDFEPRDVNGKRVLKSDN
ncbi:putative intracellular protease 1 [Xylogone sp. PMI_703]|nr:putative intracellular protease 1 [Xylogone sp. PMI_703]